MEKKDHGLQQVVPWRPCTNMHLDGARSVLVHGAKPYGLTSHSKYTNPTAIADTTTKCMHILPAMMVVPFPTPEPSVLTRGIARWGFWQLISRFVTCGIQRC